MIAEKLYSTSLLLFQLFMEHFHRVETRNFSTFPKNFRGNFKLSGVQNLNFHMFGGRIFNLSNGLKRNVLHILPELNKIFHENDKKNRLCVCDQRKFPVDTRNIDCIEYLLFAQPWNQISSSNLNLTSNINQLNASQMLIKFNDRSTMKTKRKKKQIQSFQVTLEWSEEFPLAHFSTFRMFVIF